MAGPLTSEPQAYQPLRRLGLPLLVRPLPGPWPGGGASREREFFHFWNYAFRQSGGVMIERVG